VKMSFVVESKPTGAQLSVDGVGVGLTPQIIKDRLPGQDVALKAVLTGHQDITERLTVASGMAAVTLNLVKVATVFSDAESAPSDVVAVNVGPGVLIEFVRVPAGKSEVTSERKVDYVLDVTEDVWFARTELTQEQYQSLIGDNRSTLDWRFFPGDAARRNFGLFPVNRISFEDTRLVVAKINWALREQELKSYTADLPREVEWEYAARGGNNNARFPLAELKATAIFNQAKPEAVTARTANGYGLFGFLGNVGEWCHPSLIFAGAGGAASTMVIRGGAWNSNDAGVQPGSRVVVTTATNQNEYYGLRLVLRATTAVSAP